MTRTAFAPVPPRGVRPFDPARPPRRTLACRWLRCPDTGALACRWEAAAPDLSLVPGPARPREPEQPPSRFAA